MFECAEKNAVDSPRQSPDGLVIGGNRNDAGPVPCADSAP